MKRLIYVSTASENLELSDLKAILDSAVERNVSKNITGILIFNGLNFMQVLEGAAQDVDEIYALIVSDTRHSGVITILSEDIIQRCFPNWAMRLSHVPTDAESTSLDLSEICGPMELPQQVPPHVSQLLKSFNTLKS